MKPFFFHAFIVIYHVLEINKVKKKIAHERSGEKFLCTAALCLI